MTMASDAVDIWQLPWERDALDFHIGASIGFLLLVSI